jgi:hypothetical protein
MGNVRLTPLLDSKILVGSDVDTGEKSMRDEDIERTGDLLIEEGIVTAEDLEDGIRESNVSNQSLIEALGHTCPVRRAELSAFLTMDFRIPEVDLTDVVPQVDAIRLVPESVARKHQLVPVAKVGNVLCIAKPNFYNRAAVREVREITGLKIKVLQASEEQVDAAIESGYAGDNQPAKSSSIQSLEELTATVEAVDVDMDFLDEEIAEVEPLEIVGADDVEYADAIELDESHMIRMDELESDTDDILDAELSMDESAALAAEIDSALSIDEVIEPEQEVDAAPVSQADVDAAAEAAYQGVIDNWEHNFVSGDTLEAVSSS